jgi:hypothetical protein
LFLYRTNRLGPVLNIEVVLRKVKVRSAYPKFEDEPIIGGRLGFMLVSDVVAGKVIRYDPLPLLLTGWPVRVTDGVPYSGVALKRSRSQERKPIFDKWFSVASH